MSRRLRRLLSGSVAAAVVLALPTSYAAVEASEGSDGSISVEGYVAGWGGGAKQGTLWWSDHRSYNRRVALAEDLGLHGVAVWQLASADPLRG
jgi:hypothetical protein